MGLLELAGEAGGRHGIAGAPDAGAAALAMGDEHRLAQPRGDRRGGVPDMDHERSPGGRPWRGRPGDPDRGAVDPLRGQAR
jgi:hypothetical protein